MLNTLKVSQTFVETIVRLWSPTGSDWLSVLPVLIERYFQKWQLSDLYPSEHAIICTACRLGQSNEECPQKHSTAKEDRHIRGW